MNKFLEEVKEVFKKYILDIRESEEKSPIYEDFNQFYNREIQELLNRLNINLYKHQKDGLEYLYSGKNVVVTTPTASGKSEIFRLYILDHLLSNPNKTFLLVYPTRALLYDQYEKFISRLQLLENIIGKKLRVSIRFVLGDMTYKEKQEVIREKPNIIFTTVDNLHLFLLKNHDRLFYFFKNLDLIVIDEVHSYRGIFGTNAAYVFRRLFRVLEYFYKNKNYKILALSATLINAKEFCERLFGKEFEIIDKDYSKRFKKYYVVIDPKYRPSRAFLRKMIELLYKHKIKSLVFLESKKGVELSKIAISSIDKEGRIQPYKASFTKDVRRELEKKFKENEILILITTSALELGIDIGDVESVVNYGIPKDGLFSLIQRIGRAGRSSEGYAIVIFKKDALDFYYSLNIEEFFDRVLNNKIEKLPVNLNNDRVIKKHLIYLVKELGKLPEEAVEEFEKPYIHQLIKEGYLQEYKDPFFGKKYYRLLKDIPYSGIRNISEKQYYLIEYDPEIYRVFKRIKNPAKARNYINLLKSRGKIIEELDEEAFYDYMLPGMVYYSLGRSYRIKDFVEIENYVAIFAEREKFYSETYPLIREDVEILEEYSSKRFGDWTIKIGKIRVKKLYVGYIEKFKYGEDIEYKTFYYNEPIERILETKAIWILIPPHYREVCQEYLEYFKKLLEKIKRRYKINIDFTSLMNLASSIDRDFLYEKYRGFTTKKIYEILEEYLKRYGIDNKDVVFIGKKLVDYFHCFQSGLHAIEHNIIKISPAVTNVDSRELGGYSYPIHPQTSLPTIFIYEGYQGGVGLAEILFENIEKLIQESKESIYKCKCKDGCPRCILSSKCGNFNEYLDKYSARFIYKKFFTNLRRM